MTVGVVSIRIYLVQHAEAPREEDDPARPLTEQGWSNAGRIAKYGVERAGIRVHRIYHSGKLRARQTAEAWGAHLGSSEIAQTDGLDPSADPTVWARRLDALTEDTMLVGHLPHLDRLISLVVCGNAERGVVAVRNAGVVCLERTPEGRWTVMWALTPEIV